MGSQDTLNLSPHPEPPPGAPQGSSIVNGLISEAKTGSQAGWSLGRGGCELSGSLRAGQLDEDIALLGAQEDTGARMRLAEPPERESSPGRGHWPAHHTFQ